MPGGLGLKSYLYVDWKNFQSHYGASVSELVQGQTRCRSKILGSFKAILSQIGLCEVG